MPIELPSHPALPNSGAPLGQRSTGNGHPEGGLIGYGPKDPQSRTATAPAPMDNGAADTGELFLDEHWKTNEKQIIPTEVSRLPP